MLSDHCFQRSLLADRGCEFRAQAVQANFGFRFRLALVFQRLPGLRNFVSKPVSLLGHAFKLQRQLSALPAEGFDLRVGGRHFGLKPLGVAIHIRHPLF